MSQWQWIGDQAGLQEALNIAGDSVGVDTEFVRETTYFPIPGLIQIGNTQQVFLIDPLAKLDFTPMADWMGSTQQTKIMHAGFEDLELFAHHFDCVPSPYFDTQLAEACLGGPISLGLDALVQSHGFAALDKSKSRNDWTVRPLARDLLDYAAQDVVHLPQIADRQRERLIELDRLHWLIEEQKTAIDKMQAHLAGGNDPMDRVKGLHHLDGRGMTVMRAMVNWREDWGREHNIARSRIARDEFLLDLAGTTRWPNNLHGLSGARGHSIKTYGDSLRRVYEEAMGQPAESALPAPQRPSSAEKAAQKALRSDIQKISEQAGLVPEFVAKRRDIERWAAGRAGPKGWRAVLLESIL